MIEKSSKKKWTQVRNKLKQILIQLGPGLPPVHNIAHIGSLS